MEHIPVSHIITGLALALTFGGMTFFSAVLAPLVFTRLPIDTAGTIIRQLFPGISFPWGSARCPHWLWTKLRRTAKNTEIT